MTQPWHLTTDGILLHIHLQPRASRNRVVGVHGEVLKIALTAPRLKERQILPSENSWQPRSILPAQPVPCPLEKNRDKRVLIRTFTPDQLTYQLEEVLMWVDKKK